MCRSRIAWEQPHTNAVLMTSRPTILDVLRVLHGDNSCVKDHSKVFLKKETCFVTKCFPS